MAQYSFGSGILHAKPLTDSNGLAIATPTPLEFGVLQDVSVDISFDIKELYGRQQFAVDMARGKGKITSKAKAARINGGLMNSLMFGQTVTTGTAKAVSATVAPQTIPANSPYTLTITPPNTGVYISDLGVTDIYGTAYARVASTPSTGQYSVDESTGVYTFAAADASKTVFINYRYSATIAGSKSSTVINKNMGDAPTFEITLFTQYKGKFLSLHLYNCMSSKLGLATKQDDYLIPEFEFSSFADDQGRVFDWSTSE